MGDKLPQLERQREDIITKINSKFCRHERFWIRRLENLEPIEIPYAERQILLSDSPQYREVRFLTPEQVLANLENFESLGDFILAAFLLYLSRIGDKVSFDINFQDVTLQQELSDAELFFEPYVPLHIDLDGMQNFKEFYNAITQQIKSTRSHGSYARDLIIRTPTLREIISRNLSRGLPVAIKRVKRLYSHQPKINAELVLIIPDDGKECVWLYDNEVLNKTAIDRMQEQFAVLLNDIAINKNRSIAKLSILPEQEKQMLITEWNSSSKKYPLDGSLHQRFEAQVNRAPDAVALVYKNKHLTYRQLNRHSNQVARCLRAVGVGPEVLVGLCMKRNINLVVGLLGILKAGGAYLPLDPTYPKERLAFMIEDSKAPVILTQKSLISNLPTHSGKILCLNTSDVELKPNDMASDGNLSTGIKPKNLAYVIDTSGSTGKPKGALIFHGNIMRLFDSTESWFNFEPEDVWALFHSYAFDFSVWEIWGSLLHGGR
ncbi:AMP-binding protein, partial [bacterium]|nr:AMP-binding protein [bacterium]